jgi:hypothetical protein
MIERQPPPDREHRQPSVTDAEQAAAQPSVAALVASLHGRAGKTLLARVLADYFVLSGRRPIAFDTDTAERALYASFPYDTIVVDVDEVRDQMILFDTLATRSPEARVVDVSHHVFRKFFKVMQDTGFVGEARGRGVEPIIFYITDRNPDAYQEARLLRDRFAECGLILVDNAFVGRVKDVTRRSPAYHDLEGHDLRMSLPRLDAEIADAIEDRNLSLSAIVTQPLSRRDAGERSADDLPFEQREALRAWLVTAFREIHRLIRAVEARAPSLLPAAP